jgi:hypothetical protein
LRIFFEQPANDNGGKFVWPRIAQCSSRRFAHGSAQAIDDYGFLHSSIVMRPVSIEFR